MSFNQFQQELFKSQIEYALDRADELDAQHALPNLSLTQAEPIKPTSIDAEKLDLDVTRTQRIETADGTIWVDGNTLMCSCPDCTAPMSIRIWLGLADCWACESCVELTAEQLHAARQLMADQAAQPTQRQQPVNRPHPNQTPQRRPNARRIAPVQEPIAQPRERRQPTALKTARAIRSGISTLPAWFISFIIHLVILLLLAIYLLNDEQTNPAITIATFVSPDDKEGGEIRDEELDDPIDDEITPLMEATLDQKDLNNLMKDAAEDAEMLQKNENQLVWEDDVEDAKKNRTIKTGQVNVNGRSRSQVSI